MKYPFLLTYSVKQQEEYSNSEDNCAKIRQYICDFLSQDKSKIDNVIKHSKVETAISGRIYVPNGTQNDKEDAVTAIISAAIHKLIEDKDINLFSFIFHAVIYAETLDKPVELSI